jgi:hypothetical protein
MAESVSPMARRFNLRPVVAAMWALEIFHLALPNPLTRATLMAGLGLIVAMVLLRARWQTRLLSATLFAAIAALCTIYDVWHAVPAGVEKAFVFIAFLSTIALLHATADQRPEIAAARTLFTALPRQRRGGGVLVGAHVLGSVLIVGVIALMAPILGRDAPEDERLNVLVATMRGLCLAVLWSPFFVGMGVASHHVPSVRLWQIMPLGLGFAALGLITAYLMFDRAGGLGGLWRSLASLAPILPPVGLAALSIVLITAVTPLSTLHALVFSMPVLCIAALAFMGRDKLAAAVKATYGGLGGMGPELCILTLAVTLGVVVQAALSQTEILAWLQGLQLGPLAVIAVMIGGMTAAGLLAIHPIVTGTVLLVLFTSIPTGVADVVLMEAMLFGWALGTLISLSSVTIATGSAIFSIPPERLITKGNIMFSVVFGTLSVFILGWLNTYLAG